MKTFKLNFKNTSNKLDFVLIYAINEGNAMEIFAATCSPECMLSIENVTNKFIDFK
jgi:hypothetical protein